MRAVVLRRRLLSWLADAGGMPVREGYLRDYLDAEMPGLARQEFLDGLEYLQGEGLIVGVASRLGGETDRKWRITELGQSVLAEEMGG